MENSKIEWTHHTFNAWEGCEKVSAGCTNCYAEARDKQYHGGAHWGPNGTRKMMSEAYWKKPLKWNRDAAKAGERRRVFCASLADVFEDRPELLEPRRRLFDLINDTPNLDWLLLTKRPENVTNFAFGFPDNIWIGTSVENRKEFWRINELRKIPAKIRFLSIEPLLEDLGEIDLTGIGWAIVGGESGPQARPVYPDWARSLRDQCEAAGVAFHFKQWGEYLPYLEGVGYVNEFIGESAYSSSVLLAKNAATLNLSRDGKLENPFNRPIEMVRVGKKAAGRLLDGREWNEFPKAEVV